MKRWLVLIVVLAAAATLGRAIVFRFAELEGTEARTDGGRPPAPVAVAPVERGPIVLRRTFSGALEASAEFVVAPKIAGRIDRVLVQLGDPVERGQVVAHLDDDELQQAVHLAEADLAVEKVSRSKAERELEIAARNLKRLEGLVADGVTSESQLDTARIQDLTARTAVDLATAGITRAEAALEAARIRLSYARIRADWNEGDDRRIVSARLVDEGDTVSANTALLSVVELDPILAVVFAPERDYARLAPGQTAELTTDAHPGRTFEARIVRIAPVFRRATRQARIELEAPNPGELLKPGMFVRATIQLARVEDATIVPYEALTERDDRTGVFVLDEAGETAHWRPVDVGVREGARVEVHGDGVTGRVVVLGQELCDDGGPVTVPAKTTEPEQE